MIVIWIVGLVVGVTVAAYGSRRAVGAALDTADALGISAGFVGITILAIGTDLPEIANSIMASITGHGDINVGDSTGSALTQVTLVLAILILVAGMTSDIRSDELRVVVPAGLMAVGALVLLAVLISDGHLGRFDGLLLIATWVVSVFFLGQHMRDDDAPPRVPDGMVGGMIATTLFWLTIVGVAAIGIVKSFVEITDAIGVPEFIASTIVLSIGTSVPELVVDWTAIRRGAAALALGDLFGATLIDSTLSVGSGPMVSPTAISDEALAGTLIIAIGVAVATLVVVAVKSRRSLAGSLFAVYALSMAAIVTLAG